MEVLQGTLLFQDMVCITGIFYVVLVWFIYNCVFWCITIALLTKYNLPRPSSSEYLGIQYLHTVIVAELITLKSSVPYKYDQCIYKGHERDNS
jgi:hypothetical protein